MHRVKVFVYTFLITLTVALATGGFLVADVNTRRVTFEDSTPPYAADAITAPAIPLPVGGEVLRLVFQGEKAIFRFLWDNYENIT